MTTNQPQRLEFAVWMFLIQPAYVDLEANRKNALRLLDDPTTLYGDMLGRVMPAVEHAGFTCIRTSPNIRKLTYVIDAEGVSMEQSQLRGNSQKKLV